MDVLKAAKLKHTATTLTFTIITIGVAAWAYATKSEDHHWFDVVTGVSPIWALFIALFLPAWEKFSRKIDKIEEEIDYHEKMLLSLMIEVSTINALATHWLSIEGDAEGNFFTEQLFVPSRPVFQALTSNLQRIDPEFSAVISTYEITLDEKFYAIGVMKNQKIQKVENLQILCSGIVNNCDEYIKRLQKKGAQGADVEPAE